MTEEDSGKHGEGPKGPNAEPTFDENTGAIRGAVMSEEEVPIEGAEVGAVEAGATTRTGPSGEYALSNLPPGDYRVHATKLGYGDVTQTVTVQAGDVTDGVNFVLPEVFLPNMPYHTTHLIKATLSGLMWKLTPTCIYTTVNPLVKTCGGIRLSCDPETACEVHTPDLEPPLADTWATIIGEVRWTPQSGATGHGFSFDINAPNVTRGPGGSINQADPYTFNVAQGTSPIVIRIDKTMLAERGIAEADWNNYPDDDCTAPDPDNVGNCDWFYRIFPAACDLNICPSGFGPDYGFSLDNQVEIYFSYFIVDAAPADFTALPEG